MNNLKTFLTFSLTTLAVLGITLSVSAAPDAKEIMIKNDQARKVKDITSTAKLITGGGDTKEKTKEFTWWRKLTADGARFNTLTRFHAPAEVKGEGILFLEHSTDKSEVLLYLPNFKKIRRVESQQQSGSFMGSEFSYSDISSPSVENYNYKHLGEEACPDDAKIKCHLIESTPKDQATKDRTGYAKTVQWVRQDNFMIAKAENYNLESKLFKRVLASEIKEIDSTGHKWMAHNMRIDNLMNKKFTTLNFSDVKVNTNFADSTFTQQNLSRP